MAYLDAVSRMGLEGSPARQYAGFAATASAAITGGITEAQAVAGGETFTAELTADTYLAAGTGPIGSIANTQALIDGIVSAQGEAAGWNAVRSSIAVTDITRTSDTVATLTLPALAYSITADETLTWTIPAEAVAGSDAIVGAPTITITNAAEAVPEVTGGGWAAQYFYDKYVEQRREREEEREKVRVQVESIEDDTDAQIARLLHKQIEQDARRSELESLEALVKSTYTERQERLALEYNERVAKAYVRAATQANFSAMEAFEREMDRAREEEEFLFLAMTVLQ